MLRKTFIKIRKVGACPNTRSWRGLSDDKSKHETFSEHCKKDTWIVDAVGPPPDDDRPGKRSKKKDTSYKMKHDDVYLKLLAMKEKSPIPLTKNINHVRSQKSQRIIADIFGDEAKRDIKVAKDTNVVKSIQDLDVKSVAESSNEETLTQKIEKIKDVNDVPITEAQHVEEFETSPKPLNMLAEDPEGAETYNDEDKALDALASQCLNVATTQIDDNLLDGMSKLVNKSSHKLSMDSKSKSGIVKPKARRPTRRLKKKSMEPTVGEYESGCPTIKDDMIPHPGAFLFRHITIGQNHIDCDIDCKEARGKSPNKIRKKITRSSTFMFDERNLDLPTKICESYLQFDAKPVSNSAEEDICRKDRTTAKPDTVLVQSIDFWEDADVQRITKEPSISSAAHPQEPKDNKKQKEYYNGFYRVPSSAQKSKKEYYNGFYRVPDPKLKSICARDISIYFSKSSQSGANTLEDISLLQKIRKKSTSKLNDSKFTNDTKLNIGCEYLLKELEIEKKQRTHSNTQVKKSSAEINSIPHPCTLLFGSEPLGTIQKFNSKSNRSIDKLQSQKASSHGNLTKGLDSSLRHSSAYLFSCNIPDVSKDRLSVMAKNLHNNSWIFDTVASGKHVYLTRSTHNKPPNKETETSTANNLKKECRYLDRYAIRKPKSRVVRPIIGVKIQESDNPSTIIMQETAEPEEPVKATEHTTNITDDKMARIMDAKETDGKWNFKEDLVNKISSHSMPNRFKGSNKPGKVIWRDIIKNEGLNSPEQHYGGMHPGENTSYFGNPSQKYAQPNSATIDDSTFDPPTVVFETPHSATTHKPPANFKPSTYQRPTPSQQMSTTIDEASKTLFVSGELDGSSKLLSTENSQIKMPLPNELDKTSEKINNPQILTFKRDDLVNKTNLKIEMDSAGSSLSKEFGNAIDIVIKLSDQDLCKKGVLENCLMIEKLEIITQDNTKTPPVNKKYASKGHILHLDGASTTSSKLTFTVKKPSTTLNLQDALSQSQIKKLEENLEKLDQTVNNLMAQNSKKKNSNMTLLMKKLQEKRKLESFLQFVNEKKLKFAECGQRDRVKCPPVVCPPRPRCPRIKKLRPLNRSSCNPSDCSAKNTPKKTTCKSKSKSFVCDSPPPLPKGPCAKCVGISDLESEAVLNPPLPHEYLLEVLDSVPNFLGISLKDSLPIIVTGYMPLSTSDEEQPILPTRRSFTDFWNYKNFEPWVPIPSFEKPKKEKKRYFRFPKSSCKQLPPPPENPNRPKSKSFPRQALSVPNFMFVNKK